MTSFISFDNSSLITLFISILVIALTLFIAYYSKEKGKFHREVDEVVEFYVDENNQPGYQVIYKRTPDGNTTLHNPTKYLLGYLVE